MAGTRPEPIEELPAIYTVGYTGASMERLVEKVRSVDGMLIDIRYSPRSRAPLWGQPSFLKHFGALGGADLEDGSPGRYLHLRHWGNENYAGGPIVIRDLNLGAKVLEQKVQENPGMVPILMCACADFERCHRRTVSEWLEKRFGTVVEHWHPSDIAPIRPVKGSKGKSDSIGQGPTIAELGRRLDAARQDRQRTSMDPEMEGRLEKVKTKGERPYTSTDPAQIDLAEMIRDPHKLEPGDLS